MTAHVVTDRIVFTLQDPWPVGVLTGYVDEGFILEHVVSFDRRYLMKLVRGGLAYAWDRQWPFVVFHVPGRHPLRAGLVALARRLGFEEYAPTYWLIRRPT